MACKQTALYSFAFIHFPIQSIAEIEVFFGIHPNTSIFVLGGSAKKSQTGSDGV
jgi:hypothetical protein